MAIEHVSFLAKQLPTWLLVALVLVYRKGPVRDFIEDLLKIAIEIIRRKTKLSVQVARHDG